MTKRLLRILVALFAVTLLASACSSSDDGDGSESAPTESDGADADGEDATTPPFNLTALNDSSCAEAVLSFVTSVGALSTAGFTGGTTGTEAIEDAQRVFQAMADTAPEEIRDDFDVMLTELTKLFDAMSEVSYDFQSGQPPTQEQMAELQALSESYDTEALTEASDNINAWFEERCPDVTE